MTAVPVLRWWHFRGCATLVFTEENRQAEPLAAPQFQTFVTAKGSGGESHRFRARGLLRQQRDGLDDCYVYTAARPAVGEWEEVPDPSGALPPNDSSCGHGCNSVMYGCPVHNPKAGRG